MEHLEQFAYQKLNYQTYKQMLDLISKNEALLQLGLKRKILNTTTYHYPIDYITIGNGKKDLFLVGGTHGSEHIGIDFLLNFMLELPNIKEFDPNLFTLHIIPLQNPEGFDISSNTLKNISTINFNSKAYEYYLRYRTDSIIVYAIKELNLLFLKATEQKWNAKEVFLQFKNFINQNQWWHKLSDKRVMPKITIFNSILNKQTTVKDFNELKFILLASCQSTLEKLDQKILSDQFLFFFISILQQGFSQNTLWCNIENKNLKKLYQEMFKNENFIGLNNKELEKNIEDMYLDFNHPKGSQIGHDSTGIGINLNANQPLNPGIEAIKNKQTIYGPFVKNNIKNYTPGPLGIPTLNVNQFEYAIENKELEKLIVNSSKEDRYLATLLYHGTGGQIFYHPYEELMEENTYQDYLNYNKELANIYEDATSYQILNTSSSTGYGDYLRRTYPGVLLIELSKMGGNPIGPYGDKNNIYQVLNDNTKAIKNLLTSFKKEETKPKIKRRVLE